VTLGDYRAQLEAALVYSGGTHTADDVIEMCEAGRLQHWLGPSSVIVTEILHYPQHSVCNVFLAGGNLAEIEAMTPGIEEWARAQGCARMAFTGRKGWERTFLADRGYEGKLVVYEKRL
jgi:hypothetical protein